MVHESSLAYSNWKCRWYAVTTTPDTLLFLFSLKLDSGSNQFEFILVSWTIYFICLIFFTLFASVGLYMVAVERQTQNREKMLAESLRAAAEADANNAWFSISP